MTCYYNSLSVPINVIIESLKPDSDYSFSYELSEEPPKGWDIIRDGIYRGKEYPINSVDDIAKMLEISKTQKVGLIKTYSANFYTRHPRAGEAVCDIQHSFYWKYTSCIQINVEYNIYLTGNKYILAKYMDYTSINIAEITKDQDGCIEIKSTDRFYDIDERDLNSVHNGIKSLVKFLKDES